MCADFDCEDWDENWLNSLNIDNPDSDTEEVDYDLLPPPPKLTCYKQAIEALEDMYKHSWNTEAMLSKQHL